jgi:hypothetical protein
MIARINTSAFFNSILLVHKTARETSELNKRKLATVDEIINERRGSFGERVQE